jgi:GH25 family lysozyme M1 (1,4-beta-N-acetylmuramidase)
MPHQESALVLNSRPLSAQRISRRRALCEAVEPLETRWMMARVHGVDVSQWQGVMNWTTTYNAGVRFAIAKATQGVGFTDPQWANNSVNAKAAGVLFGAYHFPSPVAGDSNGDGLDDDAVDEANYFHSVAGSRMGVGYLRPVLDMEAGSALGAAALSNWTNDFCTRIQQLTGGVDPIIYCNTNYATNYLNSSVTVHDLWLANYSSNTYGPPDTTVNGPPAGVWGTGNWDFWQYSADGNGLGGAYGSPEDDIDQDVFKGASNGADPTNDLQLLKQNFVIGAPDIPTGPSPANGASNVSPLNMTLNWNDSPGATRYDIYIDNMNSPVATNLATSQYSAGNLAGGAHTWRVVAKQASNDDDTFVSSPTWSFTASSLPLPGTPSGGTPNNVVMTTKPFVLDWADTANASTYDVYLGNNANLPLGTPTYTGLTSSQTIPINPQDGVRQWRVVAKNATGNVNGPLWSYTMDSVAPTAAYGAQAPTSGNASLTFTVTYSDATSGVDFTSIDSSDILVSGPNGYSESATLVSVDVSSNGSPRIATYTIAAPGGTWDAADNGAYTVNLNANQVKDVGGLFAAGMTGNTFNVGFSDPFAYQVGSTLHLDFSRTSDAIGLSYSAGTYSAAAGAESALEFTGVTSVIVHGTAAADVLTVNDSLPVPLDFSNGGAGDDLLEIAAGEQAFGSNLGNGAPNLTLKVNAGASVTLQATQHLRSVAVEGNVSLTPGSAAVLVTNTLSISAAGKLDLADNDLIVRSSVGGLAAIVSHVQAAYHGGAWDGASGISTGQANALTGLTTLGVADAGSLFGLDAGETASFGGETVDASAVLVKYTYAGDANLDGFISGDDYSVIDFNISTAGASGYTNGDFNYDGIISGDDYSVIDFNISAQGASL